MFEEKITTFDENIVAYICEKVIKDAMLLDVLYLIARSKDGISKIDILREYQTACNVKLSSQKYRFAIDEAIAKMVGTTFISSYREGTSEKYFLTDNGVKAVDYMGDFLEKNSELLRACRIMPKGGNE
ncbi:hypothetical protein [Aneurinibacillus aneurinilyticus]|uniref:Uncharacterized protein n=1 Tax=Aneurinibacillus aneurinilyticus ATCC 12856 TaxID=649747 RepID=U1WXA6_ANEAE|nr:hypothetical protein [Aneurinibacillus aneurinilyticus]ERI07300.1 hypothetical protein HMPREF0083_04633 [Aneurinibacillus aneurinilyticus ATCC 12856]MED0709521.1 hypothetical protein [Aneurinibacillus aneurinilyticus]MED0726105.1 hypothetical protein [Aneurinibacillus aneurinilyticus]MED0730416.1 hypothetical protein [Aneurinibacillus aneurinilyticus]MED0739148.1 hypothetical protein [Aneurinibacillus aneurinilyticus]